MCGGARFGLVIAVFVGIAAGPRAQQLPPDGARRTTIVRVVDAAGAPLAGASVTFAGSIPHLGAEHGPSEVVSIASDERGYARASLQALLCHVAWANGPLGADRRGTRSAVVGPFAAGALLELRCDEACGERRLAVTGIEPWRDQGPLQFVAMTPGPGVESTLALQNGEIVLPPLPDVVVEVRTGDGQPLWCAKTDGPIALPPPQKVRIEVLDEGGRPLASASIHQRVHRRLPWRNDGFGAAAEARCRSLGRTGDDGSVEVVVCYPADPFVEQRHGDLLFFASAAGRAPVAGGIFAGAFYVDDRKVTRAPAAPLRLTCRKVEPMAGNCGRVPRGTVAHLQTVSKLWNSTNGYVHDGRAFVADVAENGDFVFDGVPLDLHCCRLSLVAPGEACSVPIFPTSSGRELPPEVAVRAGSAARGFDSAELRIAIKDTGGGPARGAVASLVPRGARGVLLRDSVVRIPLDSRGTATVRVVAGEWALLLLGNDGWAAAPLDVAQDAVAIELAMQPLQSMRVRLLDGDGVPIAGARVFVRGTSVHATADLLNNLLQTAVSGALRWTWRSLQTDSAGDLRIQFVPVDGVECRLSLKWDGGTTADFALAANDDPLVLRPK